MFFAVYCGTRHWPVEENVISSVQLRRRAAVSVAVRSAIYEMLIGKSLNMVKECNPNAFKLPLEIWC